jgi:PAS domain S-box-containing protein/excisionase family DNA binding protein
MTNTTTRLNISDAASYLGVKPKTIRRWAKDGKIGGVKVGSRGDWKFTKTDLTPMLVKTKTLNKKSKNDREGFYYILDKQLRLKFVSKGASEYSLPVKKVHGKEIIKVLPHLNDGIFKKMSLKALKNRNEQVCEYFDPKKELWFRLEIAPVDNGLMVNFSNITDKKQQEVNQLFVVSIADNIPDALIATDKDLNILLWNKAAEKMYGWKKKEVLGKSAYEFVLPKRFIRAGDWKKGIEKKGLRLGEVVQKTKCGSEISVSVSVSTVKFNGKLLGYVAVNKEVDESKLLRSKLIKSKERLHALVEATSDVIYRVSPHWDKLLELHGKEFTKDRAKTKGNWIDDYIFPEDQELVRNKIKKSIKDKIVFELEHRYKKTDGSVGWTFSRATPIVDKKGKVCEWFGIASDITKKKEAEQLLSDRKNQLENFAEAMPQMAFIADTSGKIIYFNQRWYEYIGGIRGTEGWGWKNKLIHHPDDLKKAVRKWQSCLKTGKPYEIEYRLRRYDGEYLWHLGRALPLKDKNGKVVRWFGTNTDIHKQKAAEEEVIKEKERFKKLVDSIPVMISIYDPKVNIVYFNKEMEKKTGWTSAEAAQIDIMKTIYPDPKLRKIVQRFMDSLAEEWLEFPMIARSGEKIESMWSNIKLSDNLRVGIGLDITDRKKYEIALLEQDKKKDEFISIASHELKTPLTALKLYLQMQEKKFRNEEDRKNLYFVNRVNEQVDRIQRLVNDLLDVSRAQMGRLTLNRKTINIKELIKSSVSDFQLVHETHRIENDGICNCRISVDPERIGQVINNLINNAIKYSPKRSRILVKAEKSNGEVIVSVRDFGKGIDNKDLEKVFERFYRVEKSKDGTGFGLGLYIAGEIIKEHKGKIWAESENGKGSTFYFTLPMRNK